MKFSENFVKTKRSIDQNIESVNARLLMQAGYIYQEIAGVYTFLPLGLRVLNKIEQVVREEMNKIGVEVLMPSLSNTSSWEKTKRLEKVDVLFKVSGANKESALRNSTEYILNSTHEELVTPLVQHYAQSYKDLPVCVYQIQTKFRNEARAKSGLLRCREFRMKDLYSFHVSEEDLLHFYEKVKIHYMNIFNNVGIGESTFITYASGGDFTTEYSHEFQTLLSTGEDTIYLDRKNKIAYNKEVTTEEDAKKLGVDFSQLEIVSASEVGNIFPLNTKFSKSFGYQYMNDKNSLSDVYMGCYGIGTSRLMAIIAEKFSDDRGLCWPKEVSPYLYHLVALKGDKSHETAEKIYTQLKSDLLYDDRTTVSAGEQFRDAELIGCPVVLIVSNKTLETNSFEVKSRTGTFETFLQPIDSIDGLDHEIQKRTAR